MSNEDHRMNNYQLNNNFKDSTLCVYYVNILALVFILYMYTFMLLCICMALNADKSVNIFINDRHI